MSETMMESPVNVEEAVSRTGDREFLKELLEMFLEDAQDQLDRLRQAVEGADAPGVVAASHSIKGAAANLAASRVFASAKEIEEASRAGQAAELAGQVEDLGARIEELAAFTKSFEP